MLKTKLGTIFISFSLAYLVVGCAQGGGGSGGSSGNASGDVTVAKQTQLANDNIQKLSAVMDPYLGKGYNSLLAMNTKGFCLARLSRNPLDSSRG